VFGVNGGAVGRAPDNDWVLPDSKRIVSGHHFVVQYHGGKYWLRDISTNGVYVNDAEEPVSAVGRVEMHDGDRLRFGDYELLVSVDRRIDFLPAASDEVSATKHLDKDIGSPIDLNNLLSPRDTAATGSVSMRNAFGMRVNTESREALIDALHRSVETAPEETVADDEHMRTGSVVPAFGAAQARVAPETPQPARPAQNPDWALKTRQITREELADAMARRQSRVDARARTAPFHQQASAWEDLKSAVQAFCRGAGIDAAALTPEAQSMLPLVAGQLLREAVVGLNDISLARMAGPVGAKIAEVPSGPGSSSNPLRNARSVDEAIQRLFESHARGYAGPVESMRDVLQDTKDHEMALSAGMRAGLQAVLAQLSPGNVADQFEQGRARQLAPGQDPRPKYWEYYADFYRLITQQAGGEELPHPFVEAFGQEYLRVRAELRNKRQA
jgi:type VI secretion system FHA domain protein